LTPDGVRTPEKLAVTLAALFSVTVHVSELPVQAPLQPVNVAPGCGVAVSVTSVPES
jgi:hypothetical protein